VRKRHLLNTRLPTASCGDFLSFLATRFRVDALPMSNASFPFVRFLHAAASGQPMWETSAYSRRSFSKKITRDRYLAPGTAANSGKGRDFGSQVHRRCQLVTSRIIHDCEISRNTRACPGYIRLVYGSRNTLVALGPQRSSAFLLTIATASSAFAKHSALMTTLRDRSVGSARLAASHEAPEVLSKRLSEPFVGRHSVCSGPDQGVGTLNLMMEDK
jgi:hypothetical protein